MILDEVDSTNAEAARRARDYAGPLWILAQRQVAGRGRRGRAWTDPPGNFSATLLLRPGVPAEALALRSFAAALALYDALVSVTGRAEGLALKWPNDVLLNGGKLAGILLETTGQSGTCLAIGIGVNLRSAPAPEDGALRPVSLLSETGMNVTPGELLDQLAPAYAHRDAQLSVHGFAPLRTEWLMRAARLGQPVTARTMRATHAGTFEGLDHNGALLLRTAQGPLAIPAAEVFFPD